MRAKVFWIPYYKEVRLSPCPFPPTKDLVFKEVIRITEHRKMPLGIDAPSQVTLDWLLNILSTLDPKHQFFDKSFVPEKQPVNRQFRELMVHNEDNFYDNLPQSSSKSKRICKDAIKVNSVLE